MTVTPIRATTLTPFNYGHLAVQGGVATIPHLIGDRAIAFALAAALGIMSTSPVPPPKNYRAHLAAMPWRSSVLETDDPQLLPPLARRSDLGVEGGYPDKVRRAAASGNFKEFFTIQEVPAGQVFRGAVFGQDPFRFRDLGPVLVVRIGSNRTGMLKIERDETVQDVRLNASTALLFGRKLKVERYILHETQLTAPMSLTEAEEEALKWT
ncbi:hypothetical protein [Telmatospirillum sp. J64-1]|uniref:hypothetical protein n=1 Tax=Telmatospirillum sp. J64-1 TaxID=2502183 RepID=UPI00115CFA56|nr:hypothetical protein [Telmatospirillum sp. J64-1]